VRLSPKTSVALESELQLLAPSPFVKKYGRQIVDGARGLPILDVACGGGRNAAYLAHLGGRVVCIDIELSELKSRQRSSEFKIFRAAFAILTTVQLDLTEDKWPFAESSVGAIINVHFLHLPILGRLASTLISGGYLLIETVDARGGNFHELPEPGKIRSMLEPEISFLVYREREIQRGGFRAATVKVFGQKG
jgi:SAM-dependent methyltransferase